VLTDDGKLDINQHHLLMSAAAGAVSDASVPADAAKWRSLPGHVPGMEPEMVAVADLLLCTDEFMTSELNGSPESEGVASVAHVSQLFSRIKSRYTNSEEVDALRVAGTRFFGQFGVTLAEVEQQWELAMK
jgi:hypothetical protein